MTTRRKSTSKRRRPHRDDAALLIAAQIADGACGKGFSVRVLQDWVDVLTPLSKLPRWRAINEPTRSRILGLISLAMRHPDVSPAVLALYLGMP